MQGFESFDPPEHTLTGIELMRMLRKGQGKDGGEQRLRGAQQFYALAA